MSMINDKIVFLNSLVHHLQSSALITAGLHTILQYFLGLLSQSIQLSLVFQHQQLIFYFLQLLGNGNNDYALQRLYGSDFGLLCDFSWFIKEFLGIDFVSPAVGNGCLEEALLLDKLFVVLSFQHWLFYDQIYPLNNNGKQSQRNYFVNQPFFQFLILCLSLATQTMHSLFLIKYEKGQATQNFTSMLVSYLVTGVRMISNIIRTSNHKAHFKYRTQSFSLQKLVVQAIMEHSKNMLLPLNLCTFNNTAQIFLSNLSYQDLQQLLHAVEKVESFQQLSQLIRGRMVVLIYEKNDRTIYYNYFEQIPLQQLIQQRSNLVAGAYPCGRLDALLGSYSSLVAKGTSVFGEQFCQIKEAVIDPTLALPPIKRETVAPNCQTIYQITLAFQKLKCNEEQQNNFTLNDKTEQFFEKCLAFQTQLAFCYLNSIVDDLQHFAELSYRFMVYRNSVLSLHDLRPFSDITKTMKLWSSRMHEQYLRANKIFLKMLGISAIEDQKYGFFNFEELKLQSYMVDYVEGLVDQSITQDDVAFCGHSRQKFRGPYAMLQNAIVQWVRQNRNQIQQSDFSEIERILQNWTNMGLKPATLHKSVEIFNKFVSCEQLGQQFCCRDDYFIENCARINGLSLPDNSQVNLQCF